MHVGKKIKAWRNERGLTQVELAAKANISRSYLAGVETGQYNPSLDTLDAIALALDITSAFILNDDVKEKGLTASIYDDHEPDVSDIDLRIHERWAMLTEQEQESFLAQIDAVLKLRGE